MAIIQSSDGVTTLGIDATSLAMRATLYDTTGVAAVQPANTQLTTVAAVVSAGMNDNSVIPLRVDRFGSQASALFTPLLSESFEGTTLHANRWTVTNTTMVATQATITGMLFNSGSSVANTVGYLLKSSRLFMKMQRTPMQAKFRAKFTPYTGGVFELGFSDVATFNGANVSGAYWQLTSAGVLQPVVTFNSVDIPGTDIFSLLTITNFYTYDVLLDDDSATFICQDTATGSLISRQVIQLSNTGGRLLSATQLPVMARLYHSSAPATAPQMILTDVQVLQLDMMTNKPMADTMSLNSRTSWENPFTGVQSVVWTNSAEPASLTLSNTAAGITTLGGKFQFAAVASAVTDYALIGYTVPAPATLVVTGIDIECWNTGAAVATTPSLLTWAAGFGATAVTLAGTLVRVPLGAQSFPVGAAIGAIATRISKSFRTPISVGGGRFFHIILRMPVATNTGSQVIAGMINVEGYFE